MNKITVWWIGVVLFCLVYFALASMGVWKMVELYDEYAQWQDAYELQLIERAVNN